MNKMELGQKIKEIREAEGISQTELGNRIGLHKQAISRIERGVNSISFEKLEEIATALNRKNEFLIKP